MRLVSLFLATVLSAPIRVNDALMNDINDIVMDNKNMNLNTGYVGQECILLYCVYIKHCYLIKDRQPLRIRLLWNCPLDFHLDMAVLLSLAVAPPLSLLRDLLPPLASPLQALHSSSI